MAAATVVRPGMFAGKERDLGWSGQEMSGWRERSDAHDEVRKLVLKADSSEKTPIPRSVES